jgi:uncharacterized protein (DUF1330 family)
MAAYLIAQIEITDWEQYKEYVKAVPGVIAQYGGKYIARGGETVVLEGEDQKRRVVLLEFPSLQKAKDWYHSKEYQQVKLLREGAGKGLLIAIEGC